jgi:hypothetical protein
MDERQVEEAYERLEEKQEERNNNDAANGLFHRMRRWLLPVVIALSVLILTVVIGSGLIFIRQEDQKDRDRLCAVAVDNRNLFFTVLEFAQASVEEQPPGPERTRALEFYEAVLPGEDGKGLVHEVNCEQLIGGG